MKLIVKKASKGQVALPASVMRALHIEAGESVVLERDNGSAFKVRSGRHKSRLEEILKPYLKKGFKPLTPEEIREGIAKGANRGRFGE